MVYNDLPLFDITLDDEMVDRMLRISLVDDPAVESNYLVFNQDKKPEVFKAEPTERKITGVAIRCGMPIYRYDPFMGEYYVRFNKDVIEKIVEKYAMEKRFNAVDLQHNGKNVQGVYMVEMYIKNVERGIDPKGFEDIEDFSLFVTYKVDNDEIWNEIKNGDSLKGFSIEIMASMEEVFANEETLDSLVELALSDKKKDEFAKSAVTKAMEENKVVDLTVDNNKRITNCQIYQIGRQHGKNVAIFYGDNQYGGKQWYVYETKNITNVQVTTTPFIDWSIARKGASWEDVQDLLDTEDITSIKSAVVPANDYERAIKEHKICMITYRDASEENCTGSRQCAVLEYGFNRKGNAALRAYEYFGSTHSEVPAWKMFLLSRILSFEIIDYMEPISYAPEGFNPTGPDRDDFNCLLRAQFE